MNRPALIALLAALTLIASACGISVAPRSPTPQLKLTDLHDISQLRTAFNTASKKPRLIVLVSPT